MLTVMDQNKCKIPMDSVSKYEYMVQLITLRQTMDKLLMDFPQRYAILIIKAGAMDFSFIAISCFISLHS
jgi:hypothetical protein